MRRFMRAATMLVVPVLLSVVLTAAPASAAPPAPQATAQEAVAAEWRLWDSYETARLCNNIGAMGQLGGAWSAFTCSYIPVDDQPYWLWVLI